MRTKLFFHRLSYIQYPLMLIGFYFMVSTAIVTTGNPDDAVSLLLANLNKALIFIGLAVSFLLSKIRLRHKTSSLRGYGKVLVKEK